MRALIVAAFAVICIGFAAAPDASAASVGEGILGALSPGRAQQAQFGREQYEDAARCGPGYHYHCGNDRYGQRRCGCIPEGGGGYGPRGGYYGRSGDGQGGAQYEDYVRCGPGLHYHCGTDRYGRRRCACIPY